MWRTITIVMILTFLTWFYFCLPEPLFKVSYSNVLNDDEGQLMGATTAVDEQWRFPMTDTISKKFEACILQFEDAYFYYHPGVNPISLFKAFYTNISAEKVVRGGSTLSMQVIRLSRQGKKRTYLEKLYECFLALRLELRYSKKEILSLYAAHAPFGGNVVGLEAASWRYFNRPSNLLSWGETAVLAVLPNAPALIFPGRNQNLLLKKRNKLIDKLAAEDFLDRLSADLAKQEPLPSRPLPLPQKAPHLLTSLRTSEGKLMASTLDAQMQSMAVKEIAKYHKQLKNNEIYNIGALIVETKSGEVKAYVGNTTDRVNANENAVDMVRASRSSGSTLKPFLYRTMIDNGQILPQTLLPDIPTYISGYSPKNFDQKFDGAVAAHVALSRSLNVPAVRLLQDYGVDIFLHDLRSMGFRTIDKSAGHYGLSLILGGAEVRLWDLVKNYRKMALEILKYHNEIESVRPMHTDKSNRLMIDIDPKLAASSWLTFEALRSMDRTVDGTRSGRLFTSSKPIAWKTGTSFGHKDAWAIGVTPNYVVGVWVGNADGEGRPGLTGASTAAPLMLDIFAKLPKNDWFSPPEGDLIQLRICQQTGYKASTICPDTKLLPVPPRGLRTQVCPYHRRIYLDKEERKQVSSDCYPVSDMVATPWLILPPVMAWYYGAINPYYKRLPPFQQGCRPTTKMLDIIYPQPNAKIFVPRGFGGNKESLVFDAAHGSLDMPVYWHLDEQYIATTYRSHQVELQPEVGKHILTLITEDGEIMHRIFEVVD